MADDTDEPVVDAPVVDEMSGSPDPADDEAGAAASGADDETPMDGAADSAADAPEAPEAVAAQRDEYLDALRRTQADFENFRKRSFKQQADAIDAATGRLAEELLPVLDACDAAALHGVDEVDAVVSALVSVLERAGLERMEPAGQVFDPNAHDAVLHEPAEDAADEPVVVEVLRAGYVWKGRVLRPAMVKVKG